MRIKRVCVKNFRGIRFSELQDLSDLVVIAGQNGSGKSCILDAIRLAKSVYGGYSPNESHQWFGEFQINFSNDVRAFFSLLNDTTKPLIIEVDFQIHEDERLYLKENAAALITNQAWRTIVPELHGWRSLNAAPFTAQFRSRAIEVAEQVKKDLDIFSSEIDLPVISARIFIDPNSTPQFSPSKVLELVFSNYDLAHFGIIDYHGAHRSYGREIVSNINVNLEALQDQKKLSALYNYNNKYMNVKSEMASLYVREALAQKAGNDIPVSSNINGTLKELFETFFPEKEFLGPQPTEEGGLRFPVKVGGRETHDLDELSSGEKEILLGYLRLRNSAPKNSVILLDEPELHLNPRLTRSLPQFYYKHLAKALGNQVWLITHSDAILRESVGNNDFSVFHIVPSAYAQNDVNQARRVQADEDLEKAIIELVGDLAAYNPGGRVVIFEGEESDFDLGMVTDLFPEMRERANLVSGTNKARVRGLHSLLQKLSESGRLPAYRVFSVTDKDTDSGEQAESVNRYRWDVYHIENYLLEPEFVGIVLRDLSGGKTDLTAEQIENELILCAGDTIGSLVTHEISQWINRELVSAINTRINPASDNIASDFTAVITASKNRLNDIVEHKASETEIQKAVSEKTANMQTDLLSGEWKKTFRGRDILKRFVGKHGNSVSYEVFRNLIIARMKDQNFKPQGMSTILNEILTPQRLTSAAAE